MLRSPLGRSFLISVFRTWLPGGVGVVTGDKIWPDAVNALMISAVVGGAVVAALARGHDFAALTAYNSSFTASNCFAILTVALAVSLASCLLVATDSWTLLAKFKAFLVEPPFLRSLIALLKCFLQFSHMMGRVGCVPVCTDACQTRRMHAVGSCPIDVTPASAHTLAAFIRSISSVSYTHLTLPTICSV